MLTKSVLKQIVFDSLRCVSWGKLPVVSKSNRILRIYFALSYITKYVEYNYYIDKRLLKLSGLEGNVVMTQNGNFPRPSKSLPVSIGIATTLVYRKTINTDHDTALLVLSPWKHLDLEIGAHFHSTRGLFKFLNNVSAPFHHTCFLSQITPPLPFSPLSVPHLTSMLLPTHYNSLLGDAKGCGPAFLVMMRVP
jgi:hypothetical protein